MRNEDFVIPQRVWINCPSTLQPYHKLHGKVGIAVQEKHKSGFEGTRIYFTSGELQSMLVNPLYLEKAVYKEEKD